MGTTKEYHADEKMGSPSPSPQLLDDDSDSLKSLICSDRFADAVFLVGPDSQRMPVHKLILAAHSQVFADMLYSRDQDPQQVLEIKLPAIQPREFRVMLNVLYTDTLDAKIEEVGGLIALAKRFKVAKLQQMCYQMLSNKMDVENACQIFDIAPECIGDSSFGLYFILNRAKVVFQSEGFTLLRRCRLVDILVRDDLKLQESFIFLAVLRWARATCKREGKDPYDPPSLREVVGPVLKLVRFPLFSLEELGSLTRDCGLLSDAEVLELYTYIAQKEAQEKPLPEVSFNTTPRASAELVFKWERCGTNGAIENKGRTISGHSRGYCCSLGNQPMRPNTGKYFWEIKVDAMTLGDWQCAFGVATQQLVMDAYLSSSAMGWAYFNQGCRCHASGSSADKYGEVFGTDTVIGMLLDTDEGTLGFFHNSKYLGVAFKGIRVAVWPAGHVTRGVKFTIHRPLSLPEEAY